MAASGAWFLSLGSRRIGLPDGQHVVGRSRESDVVVRDATVSRAHALIAVDGGRVTLQDLGSSNGTRINGQRVREETALAAGDQLRLGRVRMTLLSGAAEPFGGAGSSRPAPGSVATCPACGALAAPDDRACRECDERLSSRPLSRSEAVAMSEVMAVGETLARPARSLDDTVPPYPAAWQPPRGREPAAEEGGGEREEVAATASADDVASRDEPPAAALDDASSPVAVARAAEEDSPPPRPPGAAEPEEEGTGDRAWEMDAAEGAAEGAPLFLPAAGFWARAAAFAIDLAAPLALALVVGLALSGWTPAAGLAAGVATGLLAWLGLSVPGWRRRGDSPGKRLLGLRVCDLDGRPGIGGRRALLRFAGYVVGFLTLGVGFLVAGLSAGRRGLHDHLAGTYVGRVERGRLL